MRHRICLAIAIFLICNTVTSTSYAAGQTQQPTSASGPQSQSSANEHEPSATSASGTKPQTGGIFHVGRACSEKVPPPCITPPRVVSSPQPKYTDQARKANLEGDCTLTMFVETDGHPTNIRVVKSLGMGLDENALDAVKTWKFDPAMRYERDMNDGHPIAVMMAVQVSFHLANRSKPSQ